MFSSRRRLLAIKSRDVGLKSRRRFFSDDARSGVVLEELASCDISVLVPVTLLTDARERPEFLCFGAIFCSKP